MRLKDIVLVAFIVVMLFCIKNVGAQQLSPGYNSASFSYLKGTLTATQPTTTVVANAFNAKGLPKYYSMSITGTASPVQVRLEGSLDNSNWSTVSVTNSYVGVLSTSVANPMLFFRMRANTIPANGTVTATAIGTW